MLEEWRDVVNYEGEYQVSNLGRIKSLKKNSERILKLSLNPQGYRYFNLVKSGISKTVRVHRLVAEAFIPNPEGKETVNHINANKSDNNISNLEWATHLENMKHAHDTGLLKLSSGIKVLQYTKQGEFIKEWPSTIEIKRVLNISYQNIGRICRENDFKSSAGGFKWRYKINVSV